MSVVRLEFYVPEDQAWLQKKLPIPIKFPSPTTTLPHVTSSNHIIISRMAENTTKTPFSFLNSIHMTLQPRYVPPSFILLVSKFIIQSVRTLSQSLRTIFFNVSSIWNMTAMNDSSRMLTVTPYISSITGFTPPKYCE
jgi:hypothetical protein